MTAAHFDVCFTCEAWCGQPSDPEMLVYMESTVPCVIALSQQTNRGRASADRTIQGCLRACVFLQCCLYRNACCEPHSVWLQAKFEEMCTEDDKLVRQLSAEQSGPRYVMNDALPKLACILARTMEQLEAAALFAFGGLTVHERAAVEARIQTPLPNVATHATSEMHPTTSADVFLAAAHVVKYSAALKGMLLAANSQPGFAYMDVQDAVATAQSFHRGVAVEIMRLLTNTQMVRGLKHLCSPPLFVCVCVCVCVQFAIACSGSLSRRSLLNVEQLLTLMLRRMATLLPESVSRHVITHYILEWPLL